MERSLPIEVSGQGLGSYAIFFLHARLSDLEPSIAARIALTQ
jgi:hypothetical protein